MTAIWEYIQPWIMYGLLSAFMVFCPWALDQLRASAWYSNQRPIVRKGIDFLGAQALRLILPRMVLARTVYQTDLKIAVQNEVEAIMPDANTIRARHGGDVPKWEGNLLQRAVVDSAMQTIAVEQPEIFKAIPARTLEAQAHRKVKPAVKAIRKRTGGTSPGSRR